MLLLSSPVSLKGSTLGSSACHVVLQQWQEKELLPPQPFSDIASVNQSFNFASATTWNIRLEHPREESGNSSLTSLIIGFICRITKCRQELKQIKSGNDLLGAWLCAVLLMLSLKSHPTSSWGKCSGPCFANEKTKAEHHWELCWKQIS